MQLEKYPLVSSDKLMTFEFISDVSIDQSLNQYDSMVLFPRKLEKANEMLRKTGLPKQWTSLA
jgi:hypothetical protein